MRRETGERAKEPREGRRDGCSTGGGVGGRWYRCDSGDCLLDVGDREQLGDQLLRPPPSRSPVSEHGERFIGRSWDWPAVLVVARRDPRSALGLAQPPSCRHFSSIGPPLGSRSPSSPAAATSLAGWWGRAVPPPAVSTKIRCSMEHYFDDPDQRGELFTVFSTGTRAQAQSQ